VRVKKQETRVKTGSMRFSSEQSKTQHQAGYQVSKAIEHKET